MAFTVHPTPDHVHIQTECLDHSTEECSEDHWQGGRPDPVRPVHVEVDVSTGLVGYTYLTPEEIVEWEKASEEKEPA